jgi:hypothetical protein
MIGIHIICANAGLPSSVADFLVKEGRSAGEVIMAAANYRTKVIRRQRGASVFSFLVEAAGESAARKYLAGAASLRAIGAPRFMAEKMEPPKPGEKCELCGQVMPADSDDDQATAGSRLLRAKKMEPPKPGEKCSLCGQVMPGGPDDQVSARALKILELCERASGAPLTAAALIGLPRVSRQMLSDLEKLELPSLKAELVRLANEDKWNEAIGKLGIKKSERV